MLSNPALALSEGQLSSFVVSFLRSRSSSPVLTADLQFTLHHVLPAAVHRLARVHSPIKWTRFTDLQSQNAVVTEHPVLGFIGDVHLVFVPGHFGLA